MCRSAYYKLGGQRSMRTGVPRESARLGVSYGTVLGIALAWVALASVGIWWLWRQRRVQRPTPLKKVLMVVVALTCLLLVTSASAGLRGLWLERRGRPVTSEDVRILTRVNEILRDESVWNRQDDRQCADDNTRGRWSLFCALEQACIDVLGQYDHRRVALQEVRFAVEDATRGRQFEHRLMDFNNLPETQFRDVKRVLQVAAERVATRLRESRR
jgi:hypothetical protein